ncbi:BrnA antitoxin family protein [Candidatus Gracilibacteria bacterium]|nr:BrnA antitoxin family protein [Candidatus Gracilibacteria bacterium]
MQEEYDFTKGTRRPVVPVPNGKIRITIRIDEDILEWFRTQVEQQSGGNYQTMMNTALREYIHHHNLEEMLRKVVREELQKSA